MYPTLIIVSTVVLVAKAFDKDLSKKTLSREKLCNQLNERIPDFKGKIDCNAPGTRICRPLQIILYL